MELRLVNAIPRCEWTYPFTAVSEVTVREESLLWLPQSYTRSEPDAVASPWLQSVVLIVCFATIGPLPILVDCGRVVQDVLDWLAYEKRDNLKSASTLYRYCLALSRFCDFWKWHQVRNPEKPILTAFFDSLVHGEPELGWTKGVAPKTADQLIEAMGKFLDWFSDRHNKENPNPRIEEALSYGRLLAECARRYKNDFLFHLMPATKRSDTHTRRRRRVHRRIARSASYISSKSPKTFLFDEFLTLAQFERDARNLLLWLLLGPGGLRLSECLHLFVSDISQDRRTGEARILLADPVYGRVQSPTLDLLKLTRKRYLHENFSLVTRYELPLNDIQYVGWKGMKYQDPINQTAGVTWLHPYFGQLFWKLHEEQYLTRRGSARPKHPWYFVNLAQNIGEPLSASNSKGLFGDICTGLNLQSPHNVHSLRHMYVDTLVNTVGLTLAQAQILVRHISPDSTALYAEASADATRLALRALSPRLNTVFPNFETAMGKFDVEG